jgi:hypothetical protein
MISSKATDTVLTDLKLSFRIALSLQPHHQLLVVAPATPL